MTVNVDTYVLPEESDLFLSEVLPSAHPLRIAWGVLTSEEKTGYLAAALRRLEALNYAGDKVWYYQPLKFPRYARNYPFNYDDAPDEVKRAQVVWATEILREEMFVKKRNTEACVALGFIDESQKLETQTYENDVPKRVKELLQRWLTSWRRV